MSHSEKEKMIAGELYNSADRELTEERIVAHRLCKQLSELDETETKKIQDVLGQLLGKIGKNSIIMSGFICDYGYNISLGDNTYLNFNCLFIDVVPIRIGSDVLIGPNVKMYTVNHPIDPRLRKTPLEYGKPITIEDSVWLGGGCVILPGVTIGRNSIIGAGSVVTKNIPANSIAVGNPARVVKQVETTVTDEQLQ